MNKKIIWGSLIVIMVAVIIIVINNGYAERFFTYLKNSQDPNYGWTCCAEPSEVMTDWKTYTNSEYGFEIKYPDTISFMEGSYQSLGYWYVRFYSTDNFQEGPLAIRIEKKSLGDMSVANSTGKIEERTIAGINGKILIGDASGNCKETFVNMKDWTYIFSNQCGQDLNLFEQMTSTFKFTK